MADLIVGTFQVTAMSQMNPAPTVPTPGPLPGPPEGTPVNPPPTVNVSLTQLNPPQGAGPGSLMLSGYAGAGAAAFAVSDIHLGKQYEVILREVL